jgi:hypothetical protein
MPNHASTTARVRAVSDVKARPVEWLWRPWIPLGKPTILDGDPGVGKGTLYFDLAARVSRDGVTPVVSAGMVGASVILSAEEDGEADTIRPRLDPAREASHEKQMRGGRTVGAMAQGPEKCYVPRT